MVRMVCVLLLLCLSLQAGTRVKDTIFDAAGRRVNGQARITWPAFISPATGRAIPAGSITVNIASGVLDVNLEPTPSEGTVYTVRYLFATGATRTETWGIPISATPITTAVARGLGSPPPITPGVTLAGDVLGQLSATQVVGIRGMPVDTATPPQDGEAMKYDAASGKIKFGPVATEGGTTTAGGDLSGPVANAKVEKIQGVPVDPTAPLDGQMMRFNVGSGRWEKVTLVDQETPAGLVNGSNRFFTLSQTPNPLNGLMVFRNGVAQKRCPASVCDYDVSGNAITFIPAATPQNGDVLTVWFRY